MYVNATDLKNKLGEYLEACLNDDVIITRHGKEYAVLKGIKDGNIVNEESAACNYADTKSSIGKMTYKEFKRFTENTEERYELIDGHVYIMASPKVYHQFALSKLYGAFFNWFEGKNCIPFFAPFDITLNLQRENPDVVQPDLIVICDLDDHLADNGYYMGVPSLLVEILSESTKRKDLITKLNLYMNSGVSEYWIVNCGNGEITIYKFEDKNIKDNKTFITGMTCKSFIFEGLEINTDGLFMKE